MRLLLLDEDGTVDSQDVDPDIFRIDDDLVLSNQFPFFFKSKKKTKVVGLILKGINSGMYIRFPEPIKIDKGQDVKIPAGAIRMEIRQ